MPVPPLTESDGPALPSARPDDVSVDIDGELHLGTLLEQFADGDPPSVDFRQWEVERRLGSGGMGTVYLARHKQLRRRVALKVLKSSLGEAAATRFIREAQALARIRHDNVLQIHQVDTSGRRAVIEMEYIEGPTLRVWQSQPGRSWRAIVSAYSDAGDGLMALHRAGILHRDIKPDNLLIDAGIRVKIVDLGLAVAIRDATRSSEAAVDGSALALQLTADGAIVGTLGYMAPEVIVGTDVTEAADQFSLAVSLYEAIYGVRPFRGNSPEALAEAIQNGDLAKPIDNRRRPAWLLRALRRAASFDPAGRFPSVEHFVRALRRGLWRRRLLGGIGLFALALAGAAGSAWYAKPPTADPCALAGDEIHEIWNDEIREELVRHARSRPDARVERSLATLESTLATRVQSWSETRVGLCAARSKRAFGIRGSALESELDLRQEACLGSVRTGLATVVEQLRSDHESLARVYTESAAAIEALPTCDDRRALAHWPSNSVDPESDRELAQALALEIAGRYAEAEALARRIAEQSEEDDDPWRRAEALFRLGHVLGMKRRPVAALEALDDARDSAFASGHDELFCRATAFLAKLITLVHRDPNQAARELGMAHACVERVGSRSPLLHADLLEAEGLLAEVTGAPESAILLHHEALALRRSHFGDEHPDTAKSLHNLGNALAMTGDPARASAARKYLEECVELRTHLLGDAHPELADVLLDLGVLLREQGDVEPARVVLERALGIHAEVGTHPIVRARIHMLLASMDMEQDELEAAGAQLDRARMLIDSDEAAETSDLDRARILHLEGILASRGQAWRKAADALRQAAAWYGRDPSRRAESLDAIANEIEADYALGDLARIAALVHDEAAGLEAHVRALDDPEERGPLAWFIADALAQQFAYADAATYFAIALEAYEQLDDPDRAAELRANLDRQRKLATLSRTRP